MFLKKVKGIKFFALIFLVALLVVLVLRTFFVQSYTVSSPQMETALSVGDRLLVDKTAYGVRLPVTILSIPFTFDSFLGMRSYSRLIELKYRRIGEKKIAKNDIVLFNNPVETNKPLDKRSLLLSRCAAVAGDTIVVDDYGLTTNGAKRASSPDILQPYTYNIEHEDSIIPVLKQFSIPARITDSADSVRRTVLLNSYEYFILNEKLPLYLRGCEPNISESYYLVIPAKGMKIELSAFNISLYKDIISRENPDSILLVLGAQSASNFVESYTFKENYYWFVSDNPAEAIDSRQIGFVSEKYIIGKASYIWLSSSGGGIDRDRSFSVVK